MSTDIVWVQNLRAMLQGVPFTGEMKRAVMRCFDEDQAAKTAEITSLRRQLEEARNTQFSFNGGSGELLFEIAGKIIVSVEGDGTGYTIFDADRGIWVSGAHNVAENIDAAGNEIAAAIRALLPPQGREG